MIKDPTVRSVSASLARCAVWIRVGPTVGVGHALKGDVANIRRVSEENNRTLDLSEEGFEGATTVDGYRYRIAGYVQDDNVACDFPMVKDPANRSIGNSRERCAVIPGARLTIKVGLIANNGDVSNIGGISEEGNSASDWSEDCGEVATTSYSEGCRVGGCA